MKLKLDENLGGRGVELFRRGGHDISTVAQQGLCSASDKRLLEVCQSEKRCLVTLDLEFGNPLIFRPEDYSGIALLRLPPSLHETLVKIAELEGISFNQHMVSVLAKSAGRDEVKLQRKRRAQTKS